MPLEATDQMMIADNQNIGGTYGLIYPTSGFTKINDGIQLRNYVGDASVIDNNTATITISSTINGSPASYIVKQYFPSGSQEINETYTINGQSLGKNDTYTVTTNETTSTLTINFGNIPTESVRWLTLQQVDSREFANISFTFND